MLHRCPLYVCVFFGLSAGAQAVTQTIAAGSVPTSIAVNPATNMIYDVSLVGFSLTVIDGSKGTTTTKNLSSRPIVVAAIPVTNTVYVADSSHTVYALDGTTSAVTGTLIFPGSSFSTYQNVAIAINPVTNKIYVLKQASKGIGGRRRDEHGLYDDCGNDSDRDRREYHHQ
jgi:DNA-binding beta-propeller fold protein YncE